MNLLATMATPITETGAAHNANNKCGIVVKMAPKILPQNVALPSHFSLVLVGWKGYQIINKKAI